MTDEPAKASPAHCPLCGEPNACARAAGDSRPCWCASETFPESLLARVPADQGRRSCICRSCLQAHRMCPPITDATLAWESQQFGPGDNQASLSSAAIRELSDFARGASSRYDERSCGLPEFRQAALGLGTVRHEIEEIEQRSLRGGPGFVQIQGPDPTTLSLPELKLVLAALSCQLGPLVAQNGQGDMVKEVRDRGLSYGKNKTSRYSDNRFGGNYHTDGAEVPTPIRYFPFYCLSPAAKGGVTRVVSAYSIHNRLLAKDRESLERLYQPFRWDRRGDLGPEGEKSFEKPVFRYENGQLRCDYLRTYIEEGYGVEGLPVPGDVERALDAVDRCIYDDTLCLETPMSAGQIYVANNFFTIHGRNDFEDDPEKPRMFLRTWVEG